MQTVTPRSPPRHTLCAALLICICALSRASAQTAPALADDFSVLSGVRTVTVVDDAGRETTGRLVHVTPESLTMKVDGREHVFERAHVTTVGSASFGAIGLSIGAVVDKAISRRTLRYVRTVRPGAPAVSLAPSFGVAGARLLVTAAW